MRKFNLVLIAAVILFLSLQFAQLIEDHFYDKDEYPPTWVQLLSSAGKGHFGIGEFSSTSNNLDLSVLEPGDIILGGNPGGSYGHYTHAGIYVGNNQVVTMYTSTGVRLEHPTAYHRYHWAAIGRVRANPQQKKRLYPTAAPRLEHPFISLAQKQRMASGTVPNLSGLPI